jgi:anti-anti-sigma factor
MRIYVETAQSSLLIAVDGDLTSVSSDIFREEIKKHLSEAVKTVCVDLRRVKLIDSAGLSALFGVKIVCGSSDARICLLAPTGIALDTLEMVGFDKIFEIVKGERIEPLLRDVFGKR